MWFSKTRTSFLDFQKSWHLQASVENTYLRKLSCYKHSILEKNKSKEIIGTIKFDSKQESPAFNVRFH